MNAHTTQLLAEHRTNGLHAEADQVRLARLARAHRGETGPGVVSPLRDRFRAIGAQRAAGLLRWRPGTPTDGELVDAAPCGALECL